MGDLKRINKIFGHPRPEQIQTMFKDAGVFDENINKKLMKICKSCQICHKYQKNVPKPKVGLPKAREVNEIISIDLKPVSSLLGNKNDTRYIVYSVCEFSKFITGGISPNKEAENVAKVILDISCLKGLGYPTGGFFMDNGTEFKKNFVSDLARRLGVTVSLTPSYSPWSNGIAERRQ